MTLRTVSRVCMLRPTASASKESQCALASQDSITHTAVESVCSSALNDCRQNMLRSGTTIVRCVISSLLAGRCISVSEPDGSVCALVAALVVCGHGLVHMYKHGWIWFVIRPSCTLPTNLYQEILTDLLVWPDRPRPALTGRAWVTEELGRNPDKVRENP
jgi:hypothetical protein